MKTIKKMENINMESNDKIKAAGALLAAALIILVFFSRTIYSYNLPIVTAVMPERGNLNKIELTSGIVSFAREYDVYSEVAGTIAEVLVKEGDSVKEGDALIYMDFGRSQSDISQELEKSGFDTGGKQIEADISAEKINVEIAKLELNISNARQKIDDLNNESYTQDIVSDYELKQCESDIQTSNEAYEKAKALYEAGAIPLGELNNAERALNGLLDKYEHLQETFSEQLRKSREQLSDKEEARRKQIADLEYQLNAYIKDLDAKRLDLQNLKNQKEKLDMDLSYKEKELNEVLGDYENNLAIRAKKDAVITSVNVNSGQYVGANQKLLSCGVENELIVECRVSLDNNFITVGDICSLSNATHSVKGSVAYIKTVENAKIITVSIDGEDISSGETFDIRFEKTSSGSYTLVPKGALNKDGDGYFLSRVKRRDGILGKEFYTEKLRVYIGDSDNENVAIIKGIDFPEPVALISDKPYEEGETVKIKNESDFFEE